MRFVWQASPPSDAARHLSHRSDEQATNCSALTGAADQTNSTTLCAREISRCAYLLGSLSDRRLGDGVGHE